MAAPSRDLIVNLVGKTNQLMGPLQGASAQMTQVGSTLTRTLTPAAAALGAGMALAGKEYNAGVDAIRVGTGATGAELSKMTDAMKSLSTDSSLAGIGMTRVGEILADVSTTTGATGDDLETLTEKFAQLERMGMGADVQTVARAFGDWSIATEDQAAVMDQLFLAAQSSGASIDDLSSKVVQFGAPLRNLGFEFEEATALIASFEKNGVNLETVMGGLRQGIGKLAKAGEDVPTTFRRVVSEIENAESASEATRLAIELFGQRAGPDLADAIQNGQFAVEDMLSAMEDGSDTIDQAAKDTTRLGDKFAALKNRIVGALGPFGELGGVIGGSLATIGPLMMGLGSLAPAFAAVKTAVLAMNASLLANPFVAITAAIIAIGVLIFFHRDKVLAALTKAWETVKDVADTVWNAIKDAISVAVDFITNLFLNWTITGRIIKHWDDIKRITTDLVSTLVRFFTELPGKIRDGIESAIGAVLSWFGGLVARIIENIGNASEALVNVGKQFITGLFGGIFTKFVDVATFYLGLPGRIVGYFGNAGSILFDVGKQIINGLWNGLKDKWNDVTGWVSGLGGKIASLKGPIEKDRKLLIPEGKAIMESLASGMRSGFSSLVEPVLNGITGDINVNGGGRGRGGGGGRQMLHATLVLPDGRVLAEVVAEANLASGGQFT